MRHRTRLLDASVLTLAWLIACSSSSDGDRGGGDPPDPNGTADGGRPGDPFAGNWRPLSQPSRGSTIALSEDDTRLVATNVDVGTASVFAIDRTGPVPTLTQLAEVPIGAEPVSVVFHPNGVSAYVLLRKDQKLVRIDDIGTTPKKGPEVAVGSEPTGLAIEPMGRTVWVTNWIDGTVMGVAADTMAITTTIDLNATIAASGLLGSEVPARPALAHPRAIAMTNNGDAIDKDESLLVADFYAYQKVPIEPNGANADTSKVGVVYKIPLATKVPEIIELPPMLDMGFHDINDGVAGCYPNQLSAVAIQGGFGYIASVCASPRSPTSLSLGPAAAVCTTEANCPGAVPGSCVAGKCTTNCAADAQCGAYGGKCNANVCAPNPANVRTTATTAVSIIDLGGSRTIATVNLPKEFDTYYNSLGKPDDANRRVPLIAHDIGFVPGTVTAYFPSSGTDAVFRVNFDATYAAATIESVGDPKNPFINLAPPGADPSRVGQVPTGIAVAHKAHAEGSPGRFAYVANWATRNVSVVDLTNQEVAGATNGAPVAVRSTAMPTDPAAIAVQEGKRLFVTGLGRWSYKGQGQMACVSCHADGLSDNVSWQLGRGWRQAPTLEATFNKKNPDDYRMNSWNAQQDEPTDHEGAIRGLAGGVGSIVKNVALDYPSRLDVAGQTGLGGTSWMVADPTNPAGFPVACVLDDWKKIGAWMRTIRSPRAASNLDPAKVAAGKALFTQASCQGCHGGDTWTISRRFYTPEPTGTLANALKASTWGPAATAAGFPSALFPAATPAMQTMRYAGTAAAALDQITCAIRPVGTFGVAEPGVGVAELRLDGTPAQGNEPDGKGYNVPSLLGMATGAPYLHAGQVRTLEALFSEAFAPHYRTLNPTFLAAADPERAQKLGALVQYILSIDNDAETVPVPPLGPQGGVLCAAP
jgi:cytochrome c peroxidase